MSDTAGRAQPTDEPLVTDERLKKAEEFIEEEEGAVSRFQGWLDRTTTAPKRVLMVVAICEHSKLQARKPELDAFLRSIKPLTK